ncbi:hypothetical protein GCM10010211_51840 [Streptomyces albospinus]|uniref:Uncharacterized protein n=1 Tax=Streptomyces albospinus TaxID=285515 RepID=A0ABQ2VCN0_9ACTN|nr:hypothetical protein [Streptomyces albospinus]GGU79449.1 hypothetical protein GCM10010211_51840 [Streptomyces albospinus]
MTWQYNDLTRAGGGPPSAGNPAGYTVDADKTERVVHRGADGHIHELSFDGAWRHTDLTSTARGDPLESAGDPVAGSTSGAAAYVFFRGTDSHVHGLSFDGTWHHTDLTGTAQGDPPDSTDEPIGIILNDFDEPTVLYRGSDSGIHDLSEFESVWSDTGPSVLFAPDTPPEAAGGPTAVYRWAMDNGMNVVYRSTDDHLCLLSLSRHFGAQYKGDITAVTTGNPPAAVGNPAGDAQNDKGEQHIVYRDGNGHLHELLGVYTGDVEWHHNDLSATSGAPNAAGDPAVRSWDVDKTLHVVYRGTDDHIHDLVRNGEWHHTDLSDTGAAPHAAGDPAVYSWDVDKTLHVVYRGIDDHIHEFCFTTG